MTMANQPPAADPEVAEIKERKRVLEGWGLHYFPVPRSDTEAGVTQALTTKIRSRIKSRGFKKVAARVVIDFSGYSEGYREVHLVPEIKMFWRKLDLELSDLPSLVATLPNGYYNGPAMYLSLMGEVDEAATAANDGTPAIHLLDVEQLLEDSVAKIRKSCVRYKLQPAVADSLVRNFMTGLAEG